MYLKRFFIFQGKDNFVELMVNARNDNEGVTDKDNRDASSQVKSATRGS